MEDPTQHPDRRISSAEASARPLLVVPTAVWLALGCSGDEGATAAGGHAVRDSAGVRLVTSSAPAWTPETAWRITAEPALVIGAVGGDPGQQLYEVGDVAELSDGRILLANAETELRLFGPDGGHLRTVGGEGEGPGEFTGIAGLEVRGDTIVVYDRALGRLSLFDGVGEPLDAVALGPPAEASASLRPYRLGGFIGPDELVLETWSYDGGFRDPPAAFFDSMPNLRYGLDGSYRGTIGRFGRMEMYGTPDRLSFLPFGRLTTSDTREGAFLIGDGSDASFEAYRAEAGLEAIVRAAIEPRPITEAVVEEHVLGPLREAIARAPPGSGGEEAMAFYRAMPYPDVRPAYSELVVDAEGNVWLKEHQWRGEGGATHWHVLAPGGAWLGTVTVPRRLDGVRIYGDHLIGGWADELGVEYVLRYDIEKPAGG